MFSRREFLQVAAATAALVPPGWTRAFAQQSLTQDELLRFDATGNVTLLHFADLHAQLLPVHFREPSVNLGAGEARGAVPHVTGARLSRALRHRARDACRLCADRGGFLRARAELRPCRRARPARDRGRCGARGARRQGAAARRRRHLARLARGEPHARAGRGRLRQAAAARRDDRPLGVHLRRGALQGADRQPRIPVPRAQCARHRVAGAGVRRVPDVRGRRRQGRGAGRGLRLYAGREPALDDPEMDVRHPRGRRARQCREGAARGRAACRAAVA